MKKVIGVVATLAILVATGFKAPQAEVCFKVKNDTGGSVTLHTGKGTAPMNNGTQREFCMEEGTTLHIADKGKKGKVVVEVSSSVSGKVIKLSSVM
jgi:hypothetical protein